MPTGGPVLRTGEDAVVLFTPGLAGLSREHLQIAYLDAGFRLLRLSDREIGDCSSIELPVRRIIADALACSATGLILAHNHPSGDPTPSTADLTATRLLADTARGMDLRLVDHIVFGNPECRSLRAMGLL
jgi:DNA repair protein RadC